MAALLTKLFLSSTARHRQSLGSDVFCEPPTLEVLQVCSVRSPGLQRAYLAKLDNLLAKRRSGCTPVPALAPLRLPTSLGSPELNEHLLFHGAPPDIVEKICRSGFDSRRGGEATGALFGLAAYFAANTSKSDIYTELRANRLPRRARRTVIVARVALGETLCVMDSQRTWTSPPEGPEGIEYDSVWAAPRTQGGCVDHLEVMVYNESQALPVALVEYVHAQSCCCAECPKRPARGTEDVMELILMT